MILKYKINNKRINQNCIGSALIEFALISPLLLLLIAAIIQFGFILNGKISVNSASYEGAKAGTLSETPEDTAISSVKAFSNSTLPGWDYSERLKTEIVISGHDPGDIITVKVSYDVFNFFTKILPAAGNGIFTVKGESTMQLEEKE